MKTEKLSEINLNAVKKVMFGGGIFVHTVIYSTDGDLTRNNILREMWKNNALQDDVTAVKNNNHKVRIVL